MEPRIFIVEKEYDAMGNVMYLGQRRRFTLKEAQELLPIVKRVTHEAVKEIKKITRAPEEVAHPQETMQEVINRWADKITTLGCVPNGVWLVDFDNGEGFFCWQYGEDELGYFHTYDDGFAGRTPLN